MTIKNTLALPMIGLSLATLTTFAGCDPQVDDDYSGEALATMRGSITNERSVTPPQAYAGLLWFGEDDSRGEGNERFIAEGESVQVSGNFPAQFELDLFAPPSDSALMHLGPPYGPEGLTFGWAFVGVFNQAPEQIDFLSSDEDFYAHTLGLAENHLVIYSNMALPNGIGDSIHGPINAGYTLMRIERITDADRQAHSDCIDAVNEAGTENWDDCPSVFDRLYPVNSLDTEIPVRLVDDASELDIPNVT